MFLLEIDGDVNASTLERCALATKRKKALANMILVKKAKVYVN